MNPEQGIELYINEGRLDINQLFRDYSKPLFYYALKFVDQELAKDIVQDIFYKLWDDKNIQISSSLNGFLFTMVRNKCLQQIEKQKVRNQYFQLVSFQLKTEELSFYSTESSSLIQLELQKQLDEAIGKLPTKCREVFELSRIHLKKNKEIADELQISIKTVEKHLSQPQKKLLRISERYVHYQQKW